MIEVPYKHDQDIMTDWAELSCLFSKKKSLSRSEIQKVLEESEIKNPEICVSDIWQEISRRKNLISSHYPIEMDGGKLTKTRSWESSVGYSFQLLLSTNYLYKSTKIKKPEWRIASKLFEKFTTRAIERYVKGESLNVGFPRKNGIPKGFRQCLDFICEKLNEDRGTGGKEKWLNLPNAKDRGVDVVAWQPFPDNRSGQIIIFSQCTASKDWKDKLRTREINLTIWKQFIDWMARPLIAFAFPFVCSIDEWYSLSLESEHSILLDRLRLTSLFSFRSSRILLSDIKNWCKSQAKKLPIA